jgi:MFS transporter, DHA1 family, tetracycline resistance protein
VGWFFAFVGLVIVIVQGGLIGRLTRRFGEWPLATTGPVLVAIGMGLFMTSAYVPMLVVLLAAGAINAGGRSIQQPTLSSLISRHTDERDQGRVFGLFHGLSSLARVIGPIIAGVAYDQHITAPFAVAGVIVLGAAAWTWTLHARAAGEPAALELPAATEQQ